MNTGLLVQNGSIATINNFSVYYCDTGINIFDGSIIRSTLLNVFGCGTACQISSDTGTTGSWVLSQFVAGTLNIENSINNDFVVNQASTIQLLSVHLDDTKIINTSNTIINGNIQNYRNNINYQVLSGTVLAGTESINTTMYIGKNINENNIVTLLDTSGTYTDISAFMRVVWDPPQTITSGQNMYIAYTGSNTIYSICRGFDVIMGTTSSATVIPQYWNGTSWVNVNYSIYDITNYIINNNTTILAQSSSVYMDQTYIPTQIEINGITAYWIRLPNMPNCSISNIIYHSNCTVYCPNGCSRFFGNARRIKTFILISSLGQSLNGTLTFINPNDMDVSSPYTICVVANIGMIIQGITCNSTFGQVTSYSTLISQIQTFTINATNITCISIMYRALF